MKKDDKAVYSDKAYKALFEFSSEGIVVVDCEKMQIVAVNPAMCSLLGYDEKELLKINPMKMHPEKDRDRMMKMFAAHAAGERKVSEDLPFLRKDGTVVYGDICSSPHVQIDGKDCLIGFFRDVTDARKIEAQASLFREVMDQSNESVFLVEPETGRFIDLNSRACSALGYTRAELLGMGVTDIEATLPDDFTWEKHAEAVRKTGGMTLEGEHVRKDGTTFPVEVNVTLAEVRGRPFFITTVRDFTNRKAAQEKIKSSEKKFRQLFNSLADLTIVMDTKGNFVDLNERFTEESGYTHEEMIGKNFATSGIISKGSVPNALKYFAVMLMGKDVPLFEVEGVTKSGNIIDYEVRAVAIKKDGKIKEVQATLRNVTERKKDQKEMQRQQELLSNILSTVPHFVFWKDRDSVYLGCNKNFAKVAGLKDPKEIVGKTDYDLAWKKKEADFYRKIDKEVMKKGKPILNFEEPQLTSEGKETTLLTSKVPLKDPDGNVVGILGIYTDITERKEMEEALKRREAEYRDLVQNVNAIILTVDTLCHLTFFNDFAQEFFGFSLDDVLGKSVFDTIVPKMETTGRELESLIKKVCEEPENFTIIENENIKKNGERVWVLWRNRPIYDPEGKCVGLRSIGTDVTERKRMEEALLKSEVYYRTIFENTGTVTVILEEDATVYMINTEFERFFKCRKEDVEGKKKLFDFVCSEEVEKVENYHRLRRIDPESTPTNYELKVIDSTRNVSETVITVALIPGTQRSVVSILDITELKRAEFDLKRQQDILNNTNKALEHKLKELQDALSHIKRLEGLVPICAGCKKMLVDGGDPKASEEWISLEKYISDRSEASFTHGLCPDCVKKMYGEIRKDK